MTAPQLITRLIIYYAALAVLVLSVVWLVPGLQENLPIGRTQALLSQAGHPLEGIPRVDVQAISPLNHVPSFAGSLIWLTAAVIGAFLAALPVAWVYMAIRNPRDYDQSLVDSIIILPVVVTSIVVIVQHSLALAFSLAGVAGAVRFRNNLKASGDLLFILHGIGIGLACGIGAVEMAILSSAAFNTCFIALWINRFGERDHMKRFLGDVRNGNGNGNGDGDGDGNDKAEAKARKKARKLAEASQAALASQPGALTSAMAPEPSPAAPPQAADATPPR